MGEAIRLKKLNIIKTVNASEAIKEI